ncbi:hypothetical protein ACCO45_000020 [Purpureocillium lilacinum]|uniref:Uncharacterized protein n=1 Tax=Purpureocillium lilacinum TaxID=33203 RepID=A0ACC4EBL1_PURLI
MLAQASFPLVPQPFCRRRCRHRIPDLRATARGHGEQRSHVEEVDNVVRPDNAATTPDLYCAAKVDAPATLTIGLVKHIEALREAPLSTRVHTAKPDGALRPINVFVGSHHSKSAPNDAQRCPAVARCGASDDSNLKSASIHCGRSMAMN